MNPIKVILGVAAVIIVFHLGRWGWQEWQLAQPGFHETDCWFSKQVTGDATCGYLVVRIRPPSSARWTGFSIRTADRGPTPVPASHRT